MAYESIQTNNTRQFKRTKQSLFTRTRQLDPQRIFVVRFAFGGPAKDSLAANVRDTQGQKSASVRIPWIKPGIVKERIEGFDVRFHKLVQNGNGSACCGWFSEPFLPFERLVPMRC